MKNLNLIKYVFSSICICACFTSFAQSERDADNAGSIYAKGNFKNPFDDHVARDIGDILTIIVAENSSSTYTATTNLSKSDSNSIANGIPLLQGLFQGLNSSATSSNAGSGNTTNTGKLSAQMAVKVVKVLPNGNLQVEGTRWIRTNKEIQSFIFSGTIRPEDVLSNNTVLSQFVEGAKITMDGKGSIADRQRRGILTRIVDWLF